jgi:hypothetical protein
MMLSMQADGIWSQPGDVGFLPQMALERVLTRAERAEADKREDPAAPKSAKRRHSSSAPSETETSSDSGWYSAKAREAAGEVRLPEDLLPVSELSDISKDRSKRYLLPGEKTVDDAVREYGERLLTVFKDVVQGVVNSDGWFIFPAGREPRNQLIGDTIDTFGGELKECIWVQYQTLQCVYSICTRAYTFLCAFFFLTFATSTLSQEQVTVQTVLRRRFKRSAAQEGTSRCDGQRP